MLLYLKSNKLRNYSVPTTWSNSCK